MLYIQIHTNVYTSLLHCDVAVSFIMYVCMCMYCMYAMWYTQIHTHTCSYIHIHTHTYPPQSVARRGFGVLLLPHATPMRSAAYPDLLGRGSGWDLHATFARGGPMGGAGELLFPSPTRAGRTGAQKLVWAWVPDCGIKWQGCCPWLSWVGPARRRPPPRNVSGLLWALTHKGVYVACMWPTYVYMYTHVYTCMPIHTIHAHMDCLQNLQMKQDVYTCMHICAIHAHMDWFQDLTYGTHTACIHTHTCKYST